MFQTAVESSPDHVALVDQFNRSDFTDGKAQRFTYAELANVADNLAAAFYDNGLRQDDIVVVQLPNIVELAVLYLALGKLGVILSPVPMQYGPFELEKAETRCRAGGLHFIDELQRQQLRARAWRRIPKRQQNLLFR